MYKNSLGFSAEVSASTSGSYSTASSSGKDLYIWDLMCQGKGGVKGRVWNGPKDFKVQCNDGSGCSSCSKGEGCSANYFGDYFRCNSPSGAALPPPVYNPCGPVGSRTSSVNGGYVYTFCKDDSMFVKDPSGKIQQYSQKEVGSALTSGSTSKPTLDASKLIGFQTQKLNTVPSPSAGVIVSGNWSYDQNSGELNTTPAPSEMSTGTKLAIGAGILAVLGGAFYLYSRRS